MRPHGLLAYWLIFGFFAIGALLGRDERDRGTSKLFFLLGGVLLLLFIGFRYHVGGDWGAYERMFIMAGIRDAADMVRIGDPAYQLLNWTVQWFEWPFWVVNVVCGAIFTIGLLRFARLRSDPWLAVLIALPYLIIVVSLGYTRQAVAIGIVMTGLAAFQRGASVLRFALYVAAAALFHKTAVVAMLLVAFAGRRNNVVNLLIVGASIVLLYDSLLQDSMSRLMYNYVQTEFTSQGAAIRISMSLLPALLFLFRRRSFAFNERSDLLWRNFSLASLLLLAALLFTPSSTAVDRIALYLLPLQMAVLSQVPRVFAPSVLTRGLVILYAAAIQFVWLNFADNAYYWVPYSSYLWA